jgi:hypothetical protein
MVPQSGTIHGRGPFHEYKSEQGLVRLQKACNLLGYSSDLGIGHPF